MPASFLQAFRTSSRVHLARSLRSLSTNNSRGATRGHHLARDYPGERLIVCRNGVRLKVPIDKLRE